MRVSLCACLLRGKRPFLGGKGGWGKTQADLDGREGFQPAERTTELNARNPGREEQLSLGRAGSRSQVSRGRGRHGRVGRTEADVGNPPSRPPQPEAPRPDVAHKASWPNHSNHEPGPAESHQRTTIKQLRLPGPRIRTGGPPEACASEDRRTDACQPGGARRRLRSPLPLGLGVDFGELGAPREPP